MPNDDEPIDGSPPATGLLRASGLSHLLQRLADEAAILDMPLTGGAIRAALVQCQREAGLPLPRAARSVH